jgi:hypothetical protein
LSGELSIGFIQILQIDGSFLAIWSIDLDQAHALLSVSSAVLSAEDIVAYVGGSTACGLICHFAFLSSSFTGASWILGL